MKLKLLAIPLLIVALVGCSSTTVTEVPTNGKDRFTGLNADKISIITDSKTGCKYIYVESGEGNYKTTAMSPLYMDYKDVDCSGKDDN